MSIFSGTTEKIVQRTDIEHYIDVTGAPGVTAQENETVYARCGDGWIEVTESPSAQTREKKYINQRSSTKTISSYSPSFKFEAELRSERPEVKMIYDIYTQRRTGSNAVISMITVDSFETKGAAGYPARKGMYAVKVSSCDDEDDMIIKGELSGRGDETEGFFDTETGIWTAASAVPENKAITASGD